MSNQWHKVEYRLVNDTNLWTFAGSNVLENRSCYVKGYWSIDCPRTA